MSLFSFPCSCVFLPNNGAFFVSYVIIATFVFSPLELLRFPQFLEYLYRRCWIKTRFERKEIYQKVRFKKNDIFIIKYICLFLNSNFIITALGAILFAY